MSNEGYLLAEMKMASDTSIIHILANFCNVHVSRFEKRKWLNCVVSGHTYGRSSWREPPSWGRGGDKMKSITARLGVVVFVDDPVSWDFVWGEKSGVGPGHIHPVGGQHVDPPVTRCPSHVEQKLRGLRNKRGMITIAHIGVTWRNMRKFPKLSDQFCWLTQKRFIGDTLEWTEFVLAPGDEATEINRYFWEIVRLEPSSTSRRSRVILTSRSPGTWWILKRK